jgi:hypothetical protein
VSVEGWGDAALLMRRPAPARSQSSEQEPDLLLAVQLAGEGSIRCVETPLAALHTSQRWQLLLSTEDPRYASDPEAITIEGEASAPRITFMRPGAVVLKAVTAEGAESRSD